MLENESSCFGPSWPQIHLVEIVGIKIESLRALRACNELGQSRVMMSHDFQSNFSSFTPTFSSQNRLYKNYFLWNLGEFNLANVLNLFGKKRFGKKRLDLWSKNPPQKCFGLSHLSGDSYLSSSAWRSKSSFASVMLSRYWAMWSPWNDPVIRQERSESRAGHFRYFLIAQ